MRELTGVCAVLVGWVFGLGCGDNLTPEPAPDAALPRYEPWLLGAEWSYKITDPINPSNVALNRKTKVLREEDVGGFFHAGTRALVVHIEGLTNTKDVYEAIDGDLDVRYRSIFYDAQGGTIFVDEWEPYRLKLDESAGHTVPGAQWSETYTLTRTYPTIGSGSSTRTMSWRVIATEESVTVIAGTFTCLHVRRVNSRGTVQDYWYARGVGKVKETGTSQDEELMSFTPGG